MRDELRRTILAFALFLPMATIGTVSHEMGHFLAARACGDRPVLHYGATGFQDPLTDRQELLAIASGPLDTMLLGTIGMIWLWGLRRRTVPDAPLGAAGWAATLLALFWSREVFNEIAILVGARLTTLPVRGDETELADLLGVGRWITEGLPFAIGLAVCALVLRLHPDGRRRFLLVGGVSGALAGFALWYGVVGPWLLP